MTTNETSADAQAADTTADEATQAGPASETTAEEKPDLTLDDLKSELEKARKQAARYRTERNELRPMAEKAREAEEAGKSELQKAQERIAALEAEKRASELNAVRAELSAKHGIPADLIAGTDEDSMVESAAALASFVEKRLAEKAQPHLPAVGSVGRNSGGTDRDAQARAILGL